MINSINNIKLEQAKIIFKIKKYVSKKYKKDKFFFYKDENYFINWAETEGKLKLKSILNNNLSKFNLIECLKYFFKKIIHQEQDYEILNYSKDYNLYNNLVFSYFSNKDIVNLNVIDRFLSENTFDNKRTLWIMLYQGNEKIILEKKYRNIIIFKKKIFFNDKVNFFLLICKFFFLFKKINFEKNRIYVTLNSLLNKIFLKNKINFFIYPFESQPLQHYIRFLVNKIDPYIKCFAYLHTSLPALPTEFILSKFYPNSLLSHGMENSMILKKLGWKKMNFIFNKSFRYKKKEKNFFKNKIFLPYDFKDSLHICNQIKKIINLKDFKIFANFEIVNHPFMSNSKKHLNLIKILNTVMRDSKNKTNNFCICIGSTATVIESLENNVDVVHLVREPVFEVYTSALWRHLNTKILDENIFYYNLKKKKSYINFGMKNQFIKFQKKLNINSSQKYN